MLGPIDFRGLYAIIPTPATRDAERWDAATTVDLEETARVVDRLIADGVDGIIALGTTGECPTLARREYEGFVRCVTEAAARRVPVLIGATALGLHDVVERLGVVRDAGADGTLLGLPMWQPMTEEMAAGYYAAVAEAFPDLAVMVYANERAFRFPFSTATGFWSALVSRAPTVTSAKFSRPAALAALREATDGKVHFLPNDTKVQEFAAIAPDSTTACWATAASMGPWPSIAIVRAVLRRDGDATDRVARDIAWANEPIRELIADPGIFASYNIQIEKARIDAAGYCLAGPVRPPYAAMPADYLARAKECGHRWRQLCERYRPDQEASQR